MPTRPVVRYFMACWNGVPGTPVDQHRLADVTNIVRPAETQAYPLEHPELCFYALLTGGRGRHEFVVVQRFGVGPADRLTWRSPAAMIELGDDPLALRGFPMRFRRIPFPTPGQYEFVLVCDGAELASFFLEARV